MTVESRFDAIREKLAYALQLVQALRQSLLADQRAGVSSRFVGERTGDILSQCRECFDYCAKDIVHKYTLTSRQNFHFPFHPQALVQGGFGVAENQAPLVFRTLGALAAEIDANAPIEGTIFRWGILRELNNLVNDKKHNVTTEVRARGNSSSLVRFPGGAEVVMSPVRRWTDAGIDFSEEVDAEELVSSDPETVISYIAVHKLTANNEDAEHFAWRAIETSWRALDKIYRQLFDAADTLSPHETLKSPEHKSFEIAAARMAPIETRILGAHFRLGETRVAHFEYAFDGLPSEQVLDARLAHEIRDIFAFVLWPALFAAQLMPVIQKNLSNLEELGRENAYAEGHLTFELRTLKLGDDTIAYDNVVFGIGTNFKYRQRDKLYAEAAPTPDLWERARVLFDLQPPSVVVGKNPIGG